MWIGAPRPTIKIVNHRPYRAQLVGLSNLVIVPGEGTLAIQNLLCFRSVIVIASMLGMLDTEGHWLRNFLIIQSISKINDKLMNERISRMGKGKMV